MYAIPDSCWDSSTRRPRPSAAGAAARRSRRRRRSPRHRVEYGRRGDPGFVVGISHQRALGRSWARWARTPRRARTARTSRSRAWPRGPAGVSPGQHVVAQPERGQHPGAEVLDEQVGRVDEAQEDSRPSAVLRSRARPRRLRFSLLNSGWRFQGGRPGGPSPGSVPAPGPPRRSGASTLITSAPRSASSRATSGPAQTWDISRTLTPRSGAPAARWANRFRWPAASGPDGGPGTCASRGRATSGTAWVTGWALWWNQ